MNDTTSAACPITLQLTVTITALVHPEAKVGGYSVEVPALSGCYTQGETLDEVRANLREAVEGWLDSAHEAAAHRPVEPERLP
jgi:predicted RNase H-like HicB family nuclease